MAEAQATKSTASVSAEKIPKRPPALAPQPDTPGSHGAVLGLQRSAGNRAVSQLLMQTRLVAGRTGDRFEMEADRAAEQVMRMTKPPAQSEPAAGRTVQGPRLQSARGSGGAVARKARQHEEQEMFQPKGLSGETPEVSGDFESEIASVRKGGSPLPASVRSPMESAFDYDFGQVRVHTDARAAASARAVKAVAYTVGRDIVFGEGRYAPETTGGRELLAHELAHVIQQAGGHSPSTTAPRETESNGHRSNGHAGAAAAESRGVAQPVVSRTAQRQAPARAVASPAPALARSAPALQRFPDVEPDMIESDKKRTFVDPADGKTKPVYDPARGGYIKNPSATELSSVVKNGKVAGGFENGKFMYVVDENGKVWVGKRMGESMPHPTLIGGKNPKVLAAGMVEIKAGKITNIDNHSGHFKPPRSSLKNAVNSFMKLDANVFKNLKVASLHMQGGKETFKPFRSLKMVKLKKGELKKFGKKFSLPSIKGRMRSRGFKSGAKGAGALVAMLLADYLIGKWMQSIEEEEIRKDVEALQPKVEAELEKSLEAKADEFDELHEKNPGAQIYVNVKYEIGHMKQTDFESGDTMETYLSTTLVDAGYSLTPWSSASEFRNETNFCGGGMSYQTFTVSEPIPVKDFFEEVGLGEEKPAEGEGANK